MTTGWDEQSIFTADPLNHQVVATKTDDWVKEPRAATRPWSGDNIINQNGPAWKRSRNLVNPLFKRAELNDTQHFRILVDRMIEQIPRDGSTIDMQPLVRKLYVDSATDFIFGHSVDSLRDVSGKANEFIDTYDRAVIGEGKRARPTGFLKQFQFAMKRDDEWLADCKTVHDRVDSWISSHRKVTENVSDTDKRKRYVLIDGMSEAFPDPVELRFQLLSVFSLARETPSVLASNSLFLLARNPSVWSELRKQALQLGGPDISTFDQLMNNSLFRNTVYETLRLHSPITRIRRVAARNTVLPRGGGADGSSPAFVPKGTFVWIDKYPQWRNTQIWGGDIEAFRPSRFENRALGWEFSPFSGGPRNCPANRQVIAQVIYILYRLTLEFENIENRDPCLQYIEGVMMCFYGKNGTLVSFPPAE